jgi:hypothetical protein
VPLLVRLIHVGQVLRLAGVERLLVPAQPRGRVRATAPGDGGGVPQVGDLLDLGGLRPRERAALRGFGHVGGGDHRALEHEPLELVVLADDHQLLPVGPVLHRSNESRPRSAMPSLKPFEIGSSFVASFSVISAIAE